MTSPRFRHYLDWRCQLDDPAVELDMSLSGLQNSDLERLGPALQDALEAMRELEGGAIANPDEQRMVGHYWLRAPGLAPSPEIQEEIVTALGAVEAFAAAVHRGEVAPPGGSGSGSGGRFEQVVLCGIGGSALGPMLVADCFRGPDAALPVLVLDNTDPDGIDRMLGGIGSLDRTLVLVISKSGGTPETRNAMLEVQAVFAARGIDFAPRAVAVTGVDSALHRRAVREKWLRTFPMWDWVGGRTSLFSPVGLLPAALAGVDVRGLLAGAAAMDRQTRQTDLKKNPAALLAAYWHVEGEGRGGRDMVVLPYKDRLLLLSRYLQQLVMESLGKQHDRRGGVVHQGLSVYGNKGSTDQHAFVQQLREGLANFFVVFVRVLRDRSGEVGDEGLGGGGTPPVFVEPSVTSGDFLDGFWQGTRSALADNGRTSATLVLGNLDERSLAAVIALFERAVGLYAELIDINAYHQPGVEAGKRAAAEVLALQPKILAALAEEPRSVEEIAAEADADPADIWPILCHLAANRPEVHGRDTFDPEAARFHRR